MKDKDKQAGVSESRHSGNAERENVPDGERGSDAVLVAQASHGARRRRRHNIYSTMLCHTRVRAEPGQGLDLAQSCRQIPHGENEQRRCQKNTGARANRPRQKRGKPSGRPSEEKEKGYNIIPTLTQIGPTRS